MDGIREGLQWGVCVMALFKHDFVLTCETFIGVTHPLTESTNLNVFINNIEEMTSQMGVIWERLRESRTRINTGVVAC